MSLFDLALSRARVLFVMIVALALPAGCHAPGSATGASSPSPEVVLLDTLPPTEVGWKAADDPGAMRRRSAPAAARLDDDTAPVAMSPVAVQVSAGASATATFSAEHAVAPYAISAF